MKLRRRSLAIGSLLLLLGVGMAVFLSGRRRHAAEAKRRDALEYAARWDLEHGQPAIALEKVNALAQVDPGRAALPGLLGRALVSTGAPTKGLEHLNQAVAANPNDAEAFEFAGIAHAQLGAFKEARLALTRALELEPRRVSAWRRLAQVCLTSGEVKAALEAWRQAVESAPAGERDAIRAEARTLLGVAGKPDEANQFESQERP